MRLKSILLMPLIFVLIGISGFAGFQLATGGSVLAWGGVLAAAIPLPLFITLLVATEAVARTSANLPSTLGVAGLGAVAAIAAAAQGAGALPAALALLALAILLWYVFVYSRYGRQPSKALKVGEMLPDFELEDAAGQTISSADFRQGPSLFLFFRGNWCPLCMAQIKEVAAGYRQLEAQGVKVALVSPQPHAETAKLASKFDAPMHFLVDKDLRAARALDIFAEGGTPMGVDAMGYGQDTVLPTIIATDRSGRVMFLDQTDNYRVRPEPETFLGLFADAAPEGAQPA